MKHYDDALFHCKKAQSINVEVRGENHPETGNVLWGMGRVRWENGETAEGDRLFQQAISIYLNHFGKQHSRTARMLEMYAEMKSSVSD